MCKHTNSTNDFLKSGELMSTGPRRIGKYELQELLGRGGMAEVWKAFDAQLERYVAIKLLHADLQSDPDFMMRFEREAQAVASLHHPNIVKIHDFQTSADKGIAQSGPAAYMVMECIKGQTLTEYISNTSRIGKFPSAADIIYLFTCISSAIDYAHQHRMIHRDIKPANILLDQRSPSRYQMGEPILTDFGIVKLIGASTGTQSGSWLGTPLYISPEQAQGKPGNERSDLYSLAVILYEICTGERPFRGENPIAIIVQHVTSMPTSPSLINPMITPALSEVICGVLPKTLKTRFPSASSMKTALAEAFNMSTPVILSPRFNPMEVASEPAREHSFQRGLSPTITPSASASSSTQLVGPLTPVFATALDTEQNVSTTPYSTTPTNTILKGSSVASLEPLSSSIPAPKRRWRSRLIILIALTLFLLTGTGVFYWLSHQGPAAISVVGYASFIDSQQGGANYSQGIQGINDELQIDLHSMPDPAPGKSYYAWLLSDNRQTPHLSIPLGRLKVNRGNVDFLYRGDQQHTNLIGKTSRLLITEENASSASVSPFQDKSTWRYYAELPQMLPSIGGKRAIDILRVLLSDNIELTPRGLHGGANIHLFLNSQKVLEWADSARDAWKGQNTNRAFLLDQVIRILDYLDGASSVQSDLPPNTPLLVDQTLATISLLKLPDNLGSSSYIGGVNNDLVALVKEPGVTPAMQQLATQADTALLGNVTNSLNQVHQDAKKLIDMSSAQLLLPSTISILNDMATQASYAFNGQNGSSTSASQGVVWIYRQIQRLVTFDITPYQQH